MKLMSLQCPNCNGPIKQVGEGKFYCENCDTSFLADYDKEDVEYEKIKTEGEMHVFCKHFLDKVAKHFWTLLQVQIGQSCKASTGSYPASRIAIADNI